MSNETFQEIPEKEWVGFRSLRGSRRPVGWQKRMGGLVSLLDNEEGLSTNKWRARVEEIEGTADFPILFGDVIGRQLIASYRDTPNILRALTKVSTNTSFLTERRLRFDGADALLLEVGEGGEYIEGTVDEVGFTIKLKKYGKSLRMHWEAFINDNLGAFSDWPERLARSARRTEEKLIALQFFDANGPHASLVGTNVGNQSAIATTTLTLANLETALEEMEAYSPAYDTSLPIMNMAKFLVTGPANRYAALSILNSTQIVTNASAREPSTSVIPGLGLQLIVSPWIPKVATAKTKSWLLVADPMDVAGVEFATLAGRSDPEIWIKESQARKLGGGGGTDPFDGSFETDSIDYKVRSPMVATQRDVLAVWGSTGAGS